MSLANGIANGQQRAGNNWDEYSKISFLVQQALSKMQTATLVRVESCTNSGALSPVGFVAVTPLVNQLDGQGNPTQHAVIHNVPYLRIQGGANGIIMDPVAGDIGACVFASRDISKIKSTKAQGNPGSFRQYSFSDGLYLGGMLNGTPSQYVRFSASGIAIHSPVAIVLDAPDIQINAAAVAITSTTLTHNGVNIGSTHTHGGVTPGAGSTGAPQ